MGDIEEKKKTASMRKHAHLPLVTKATGIV